MNTPVIACKWCSARVGKYDAKAHADWHRVHDLHAVSCAWLRRNIAQRCAGFYIMPIECDCGLSQTEEA